MNDTATNADGELPVFPTTAPEVFADRAAARALFEPVLAHLATVVELDTADLDSADLDTADLDRPTPCQEYTVGQLRRHVLAWLQFFAAALNDPEGVGDRLDPETWELGADDRAGAVVERAAADLLRAIDGGVAERLVVMSQARMSGDGVLAMALGEYLIHGWDLATATGQDWPPAADGPQGSEAAEAALAFLQTTVAPEYRGPDSGFFGHEVEAAADATAFERLLCFAGRQPDWSPAPAST